MVEHEDATGTAAVGGADSTDVDAVGTAVDGVAVGVAGLGRDLLRLDRLDDAGLGGIRFGVDDIDPGGAETGGDEVAALDMRMRRVRTEHRGAGVPAEVVQLIPGIGHLDVPDELAIRLRGGIDIDDGDGIGTTV